jgi:hypothetical protein
MVRVETTRKEGMGMSICIKYAAAVLKSPMEHAEIP